VYIYGIIAKLKPGVSLFWNTLYVTNHNRLITFSITLPNLSCLYERDDIGKWWIYTSTPCKSHKSVTYSRTVRQNCRIIYFAICIATRGKAQTPLRGHRLRKCCTTPPTDELTTILQQICHIAIPEPNISTCQDVGMWQIFVRRR